MAEYYYDVDVKQHRQTLSELKGELLESFGTFNSKVFEDGALSKREKELIAVAAAHITRCPYCIAGHTRRAKENGATDEEIAEVEGEPGEGVEDGEAEEAHNPAGFVFVVHGVALGADDGEAFGFEDAGDGGEMETGDTPAGFFDFVA